MIYTFFGKMVLADGTVWQGITWGRGATEHLARRHVLDVHLDNGWQVLFLEFRDKHEEEANAGSTEE